MRKLDLEKKMVIHIAGLQHISLITVPLIV